MTTAKESIARLISIAVQKGITHAIISPGSRNAPLIIAMTDSHIECINVPDERVAGFFALGMALRSGRPVLLCCTSGSAMLNYAPAIAEAYYQRIPLLILTADRPIEWIDQRAGQTMRQSDGYNNYINHSYTLSQEPSDPDLLLYNDRIANEAINRCMEEAGPVHINVPLKEPLYDQVVAHDSAPRLIHSITRISDIGIEQQSSLRERFSSHQRVLIICGQHDASSDWQTAIRQLSSHPQVAILTEATSNLHGDHIISCIDRTIDGMESEIDTYTPSLLITCGASIVSKKIRFLLRKMNIQEHWHVDQTDDHIDTYQSLTHNIPISIMRLAEILDHNPARQPNDYKQLWHTKNKRRQEAHNHYLVKASWSDLIVVDRLLRALSGKSTLHMANSTSVRYVQLFDSKTNIIYQSNRGVSGIDGCTSTAAGYTWIDDGLNVLLTGDIAFLYDSNAFWHHHVSPRLRVVILNNQGGNIFRVIPGPASTDVLEEHFEAHHDRSAQDIASAYGVSYRSADDISSLEHALSWLLDDDHERAAILEVWTPRVDSAETLKGYFKALR